MAIHRLCRANGLTVNEVADAHLLYRNQLRRILKKNPNQLLQMVMQVKMSKLAGEMANV